MKQSKAARARAARVGKALRDHYNAVEEQEFQRLMAPAYAQQQIDEARAYHQQQQAEALNRMATAAQIDAETNRLRYLSRLSLGQIQMMNVPRVVTPAEVIQSQLGPR
jgi:hypothetical protein